MVSSGVRPRGVTGLASARILKAEHPPVLFVSKGLPISGPRDDGAQGRVGSGFGHVIFQFVAETACRGSVRRALIEHAFDVSGKWHVAQEML